MSAPLAEVRKTAKRGSELVATKPLAPGTIALQEAPIVYVVDDAHLSKLCSGCLTPCTPPEDDESAAAGDTAHVEEVEGDEAEREADSHGLMRCKRCKVVYYCSKKCQKMDWKAVHKLECDGYVDVSPRQPTRTLRLVSRLTLLLGRGAPEMQKRVGDAIRQMQDHMEDLDPQLRQQFAEMSSLVQRVLRNSIPAELATVAALSRLFAIVRINASDIADAELHSVGLGLFHTSSKANHSCAPNSALMFHFERGKAPTAQLRTLGPIAAAGDALAISYIDTGRPRKWRRQMLEDNYFFKCRCSLCMGKDVRETYAEALLCPEDGCHGAVLAGPIQISRTSLGVLPPEWTCEKCQTVADPGPLQAKADSLLAILVAGSGDFEDPNDTYFMKTDSWHELATVLHPRHASIVSAVLALSDELVACQQWEALFDLLAGTMPAVEFWYRADAPAVSPVLGLHYVLSAKVAHLIAKLEPAATWFNKAYDILRLSHGEEHALVQGAKSKWHESRVEIAHGGTGSSVPPPSTGEMKRVLQSS